MKRRHARAIWDFARDSPNTCIREISDSFNADITTADDSWKLNFEQIKELLEQPRTLEAKGLRRS